MVKEPVQSATEVPEPSPARKAPEPPKQEKRIPYGIIKRSEMGTAKASYNLRVDLVGGRLPTKDELGAISRHLRDFNKRYERLFVTFYLPDMVVDDGAFAPAHHNPDLKVIIQPFMLPEKYQKLFDQ